jgi:hypothetical protein
MASITVFEIQPEHAAPNVEIASFDTGGQASRFMREYVAVRSGCRVEAVAIVGGKSVAMFACHSPAGA